MIGPQGHPTPQAHALAHALTYSITPPHNLHTNAHARTQTFDDLDKEEGETTGPSASMAVPAAAGRPRRGQALVCCVLVRACTHARMCMWVCVCVQGPWGREGHKETRWNAA